MLLAAKPKRFSGRLELTSAEVVEKLKFSSQFQSVQEFQSFLANVAKERDVKTRIKDLNRYRKNGIKQLSEATEFDVQLKIRRRKKSEKRRLNSPDLSVASPMSVVSESDNLSVPSPRLLYSPQSAASFAISSYPGYEILSANEKRLCSSLRLTPAQYISYKTCLLTNHLQKKRGQTPKPLNPIGLDKNNRKVIFNFLMRAGWITAY